MNGLELSEAYFEEYGRPMLEKEFADVLDYIAVGFVGSGSDRFGFDDELSRDHDFEPGFCIFLPGEEVLDSKTCFRLERAYAKLPKEFKGFERQRLSPVGGNRNGVMRISDFYEKTVGSPNGRLSTEAWLYLSGNSLAEATNGKVFLDNYGEFTEIRNRLKNMPEDARLKRLAGNLLLMEQSGQYNFMRCIKHGEPEAAQLALTEFVTATIKCAFLLEKKYAPYYKWSFRALREFDVGLADSLSKLLKGDCSVENDRRLKSEIVDNISEIFVGKLHKAGLSEATGSDLEPHAYAVNNRIKDGNIRNLHILTAIN